MRRSCIRCQIESSDAEQRIPRFRNRSKAERVESAEMTAFTQLTCESTVAELADEKW